LYAEVAFLEEKAGECPSRLLHVYDASSYVEQTALMVVVAFGQAVVVLMPHDQDVHVTVVGRVTWS